MTLCKKVRYATEEAAYVDIDRILRGSTRDKAPCRAYKCLECHAWHLTSQVDHELYVRISEQAMEITRLTNELQRWKRRAEQR